MASKPNTIKVGIKSATKRLQISLPPTTTLWDTLYHVDPSLLLGYTLSDDASNTIYSLGDEIDIMTQFQTVMFPDESVWVCPVLKCGLTTFDTLQQFTTTMLMDLTQGKVLHFSLELRPTILTNDPIAAIEVESLCEITPTGGLELASDNEDDGNKNNNNNNSTTSMSDKPTATTTTTTTTTTPKPQSSHTTAVKLSPKQPVVDESHPDYNPFAEFDNSTPTTTSSTTTTTVPTQPATAPTTTSPTSPRPSQQSKPTSTTVLTPLKASAPTTQTIVKQAPQKPRELPQIEPPDSSEFKRVLLRLVDAFYSINSTQLNINMKSQPLGTSTLLTPRRRTLLLDRILRTSLITASNTLIAVMTKLYQEQEKKQNAYINNLPPYTEAVLSIDTQNINFASKVGGQDGLLLPHIMELLQFLGYSFQPQNNLQKEQFDTLNLLPEQTQRLFLPQWVDLRGLNLLIRVVQKFSASIQPGVVQQSCAIFYQKSVNFDRQTTIHDRNITPSGSMQVTTPLSPTTSSNSTPNTRPAVTSTSLIERVMGSANTGERRKLQSNLPPKQQQRPNNRNTAIGGGNTTTTTTNNNTAVKPATTLAELRERERAEKQENQIINGKNGKNNKNKKNRGANRLNNIHEGNKANKPQRPRSFAQRFGGGHALGVADDVEEDQDDEDDQEGDEDNRDEVDEQNANEQGDNVDEQKVNDEDDGKMQDATPTTTQPQPQQPRQTTTTHLQNLMNDNSSSDDEGDAKLLKAYHRHRAKEARAATGAPTNPVINRLLKSGQMITKEEALQIEINSAVIQPYTTLRVDLGQIQRIDPDTNKLLPAINPQTNKPFENVIIQGVFFSYESYKELFAWVQSYMVPIARQRSSLSSPSAISSTNQDIIPHSNTVLTYPQFTLMTSHNVYMTYCIPRARSANPTDKSTVTAAQYRPSKNPRHLEPTLPSDPPSPLFDEMKLNMFYTNTIDPNASYPIVTAAAMSTGGSGVGADVGASKYSTAASSALSGSAGPIDLEKYKLLDPTSTTTTNNNSMAIIASTSPSTIQTDSLFQNDNYYITLNRAKLVPQGLLRLFARLQEPEVERFMSYDLATDANKNTAYQAHRTITPYIAPNNPPTTSTTTSTTTTSTTMDDNETTSALPPGEHIAHDLNGAIHRQDTIWIGGICYHAALLQLPRTNGVPSQP